MKKAIFPGTFDPFTLGHLDILNRSTLIFDEIIIGIGINGDKRTMFNIDQRIDMIESIIKDNPKVSVQSYDFEFEKAIARTNRMLSEIETIFLLTSAKSSFISSSIVRELISNNGEYNKLVPKSISKILSDNHLK